MGRRSRDQVWSGPTLFHSPCSDSQVREISQLWRSSRKSKGLSPRLRDLHQEEEPADHLAGNQQGWYLRAKRLEESRVVLFQSPSTEAAAWKAPQSYVKVRHCLVLGCVLQGRGSVGTFSESETLAGTISITPPSPCTAFFPFTQLVCGEQAPFLTLCIILASTVHPTLAFPWELIQAVSPAKQLPPCPIQWVASVGTSTQYCVCNSMPAIPQACPAYQGAHNSCGQALQNFHAGHFIRYMNIESPCCTPEINKYHIPTIL